VTVRDAMPPSLRRAAIVPEAIVALALAGMAAVTVADVAGRYLLNAPLPGSYELIGLLLAVTVFAGLPLATLRREHVVVDVLDHLLPRWLVAAQSRLTSLFAAAALGALAWQLWERGLRLASENAATSLLDVPLAPVALFMAVSTALAAAAMLAMALAARRSRPAGAP
jgi:TRAP-type C4-dicarboxylate transport system permease small subunit